MQFILVVDGALNDGRRFECPLFLDGSENIQEAVEHFKDAIACFRQANSKEHGHLIYSNRRTDGIPTPEDEANYRAIMGQVEVYDTVPKGFKTPYPPSP